MQNEELHDVFNISGYSNHRYNGSILPVLHEKRINKNKKYSNKSIKKNSKANNMVTVTNKTVVKRKSRLKNSVNKSENCLIVNGVIPINSFLLKPKGLNSCTNKYQINSINNKNETFENNASEPIDNFLPKLSKNVQTNSTTHNRSRLANIPKHSDIVNDILQQESFIGNASYSGDISQFVNSNDEFSIKSNVGSLNSQKRNSIANMEKTKRYLKKNDDLSYSMSDIFKLNTKNSTIFDEHVSDKQIYCKETLQNKSLPINDSNAFENKLYLKPKRRKQNRSKWQMDSGTRHEALQRIRDSIELQENLINDLFPLNIGETGIEKSDSDSSEEYSSTYQSHWFHNMAEIEYDDVKRNLRLSQLCNELHRQFCQIRHNKYELPTHSEKFMKSLIQIARDHPNTAMRYLQKHEQISLVEPLTLTKHKCAVETCKNVALPCMPTCVRHILLCKKQTLFEQCRVHSSSSFQCDRPVLNNKFHYPVCSLHSKPDFVLPDFSRDEIKFEEVRSKNIFSTTPEIYKTDFNFCTTNLITISASNNFPNKTEVWKRKSQSGNLSKINSNIRLMTEKKEKYTKKNNDKKDCFTLKIDNTKQKPLVIKPKEVNIIKEEPISSEVNEVNQNLLRDWISLSDHQLSDVKTLENNLQNEFVNGFDINSSNIHSQIQDIINSESSLSTDMLNMESQEIQNYIKVEEMIEEVEITDETLDPTEISHNELVPSEDLNAVLKQLPPEAFNELFSDKTDSQWNETQALEKVIEEMDVRKCALIDPSLLLEDIEPSYSNYSPDYENSSLNENVESKFVSITKNCSRSQT